MASAFDDPARAAEEAPVDGTSALSRRGGGGRRARGSSEESLWTVADVASYLRASRSWVYHQSECGQLPSLRIGGLLRFHPEAVRSFAMVVKNKQE